MKNQKIKVTGRGGPERLQLVEETLPEPGPDQVRVKIAATGVAWADIMMREGIYPGVKFPLTPGYDIVGEIDAIGSNASLPNGVGLGSRVAALTVIGGYSQYLCVPAQDVVAVPEGVDSNEAVSAVLNYLTAYQMLHRCAHLVKGDTILVHGGAGGVGTALLQLGKLADLKVYATASKSKHQIVTELGAIPIDYKNADFSARMQKEGGAHAAFDPIGGKNWIRSYKSLKDTGTLVCYGAYSALSEGRLNILKLVGEFIALPRFSPIDMLNPSKSVVGYTITAWKTTRPQFYHEDLGELFRRIAEGKLKPIIDRVLPLANASTAHELLNNASIRGKIVLSPQ